IDYKEKTIDWKIEANQSKEKLTNVVFEDRYTSSNMTLKEGIIVKVGNNSLEKSEYELIVVKDDEGNEIGFDIKIAEVNDKVTIAYKTDYDIRDHGKNQEDYENKVTLKSDNLPDTFDSHKRPYTQKPEQKDNGKKTGQ